MYLCDTRWVALSTLFMASTSTSSSVSSSTSGDCRILISCGVTGSGKSTILDILCDEAGNFVGGSSAAAVTTTCKEYLLPTVPQIKLVDAPGQADPDPSREEINHQQLVATIRGSGSESESESDIHAWMFVLTPLDGRITSADVAAYHRIVNCFGARPECILGVINRDPSAIEVMSPGERESYRKELMDVLTENKVNTSAWVFVPELDLTISGGRYVNPAVKTCQAELWQHLNQLQPDHQRVLRERETAERLAKEQEELKLCQERECAAHAAAETERQRVLAAQAEEARQQALAQEQARQAAAAAAATALAAQQAEQARLQAIADGQVHPIKCEAPSCQRYCRSYTVGHIRRHGSPGYNCKNDGNRHHEPRVKGE